MRLFIAVNFDNEIKSRLLRIQNRIREQSVRGKFSRPENLHLTLIFFGETAQDRLPLICSAIETVCSACACFSLDFTRVGFFKHSNKELWWIGSNASAGLQELIKLQLLLAENLRARGIKFDERPFSPHITLGREIKSTGPVDLPGKARPQSGEGSPVQTISVPVNRISLMKSQHIKGLLVYTEIGYSAIHPVP